ncbi:MAG TPA: S1 RNA-binding domain-containing protein [Patescibacteria group bacterium]|nr:S1 RNA-binding domain-containing protein [Patescibacteria group bacterium]
MAEMTMAELLKKHGSKVKGFTKSQKIEVTVKEISKKFATFDVGGKGEGILKDLYFAEARDYIKTLKPGDKVSAVVMEPENKEGNVVLSLRHAANDSLWEKLEELKKKGEAVTVNIKSSNQSGISVEYENIFGFIPTSQIGKETLKKIDKLGNALKVKIIEIDRDRKKAVFSEKEVSEEKEIKAQKDLMKKIKADEVYDGVVTTVTNFGVFVEIKVEKAKIEGLVHTSEISWEKGDKPADLFKIGDKVKVKVLSVTEDKLALSIKQAQEDPWEKVAKNYKVDDKIKGKVVRNSDFGTFVQIEPGIEGLIHITKIPPATKMEIGTDVNCYIEEIDEKNKKIALGLILSAKPLNYK